MGVGLVGTLCGAWVCAGKRAWLVWTGLHGTPPCFSSCLTRHSFPSVIFAAFPLVFGALRASSAPAFQSILAVWLFNTLILSVLLGYPAFRSMQAKPFKYMSSSALCFTLMSVIRHSSGDNCKLSGRRQYFACIIDDAPQFSCIMSVYNSTVVGGYDCQRLIPTVRAAQPYGCPPAGMCQRCQVDRA